MTWRWSDFVQPLREQGPQSPYGTKKDDRAYAGQKAEGRLMPEVSERAANQCGGRAKDETRSDQALVGSAKEDPETSCHRGEK